MVLGQILLHGCRETSNIPFKIDPQNGTCSFTGIGSELGPFRMDLDGTNPLEGAFLFQKMEHLACINTKGDLDMITLFAGNPFCGTMQVKFINAGKENAKVFSLAQMVMPIHHDSLLSQLDETTALWRDNQDHAFRLRVGSSDDCPWDLSFRVSDNQLLLGMELIGSPLVLLPGEELKLPHFEICLDTTYYQH